MHWIAVHEEVLGGKLRGFRKKVNCSEAEALGILTLLWLWARKNADINGLLVNADKDDVAKAIKPSIDDKLNSVKVTEALIECSWIDESEGKLYIHDWYEWQQYWYNYLDKKERDKERKRAEREKRKTEMSETHRSELPERHEDEVPSADEQESNAEKPKKKVKAKYAGSVSMFPEEYEKLVSEYGEPFTKKLVEELDNYKVANGKKYKDDYRAILNWVVEKCEKKYPKLKAQQKQTHSQPSGNPFADYK